jgi:ATP-dependent RNA circularization protein (DNA/RNA ligase family)
VSKLSNFVNDLFKHQENGAVSTKKIKELGREYGLDIVEPVKAEEGEA